MRTRNALHLAEIRLVMTFENAPEDRKLKEFKVYEEFSALDRGVKVASVTNRLLNRFIELNQLGDAAQISSHLANLA